MDIGKIIKKHGFTLKEVGAQMKRVVRNPKFGEIDEEPEFIEIHGISHSSVSQMINGNPTLDKLKEIASIIGCSVSELLAEDDCASPTTLTCPKCGAKLSITINEEES